MKLQVAWVFWWLGALLAALPLTCVGSALLSDHQHADFAAGLFATLAVAVTAPAWMIARLLGGSFWRPPRLRG